MVNITQDFIHISNNNRSGRKITPLYITIHNTGNRNRGANAGLHARFIKNSTTQVSWHFTVDDKEIIQHLPLGERGLHAGVDGNNQSIGIEICENEGIDMAKAEALTIKLIVHLIKTVDTLKSFPECMKTHFDWTGKNCPSVIRGRKNGWNSFVNEIDKELNPPKPQPRKDDFVLENLIIVNSLADMPVVELLSNRLKAPFCFRPLMNHVKAKNIYVIGGNKPNIDGNIVLLSGSNRFETYAKVNEFLSK